MTARLTKRQRRQRVKSMLLDALHQEVLQWQYLEGWDLDADEYADVQQELARQLYAWAVRITPPEEPSQYAASQGADK